MAKVYADIIRKGKKTLDDVPVSLRDEVAKLAGISPHDETSDI